jgi:hypothetical protein
MLLSLRKLSSEASVARSIFPFLFFPFYFLSLPPLLSSFLFLSPFSFYLVEKGGFVFKRRHARGRAHRVSTFPPML